MGLSFYPSRQLLAVILLYMRFLCGFQRDRIAVQKAAKDCSDPVLACTDGWWPIMSTILSSCISRARLRAGRFGWFETEGVGLEKLVWTSALLVGVCCLGCRRLHQRHLWLWTPHICSSSYCERGLASLKSA